MVLSPSCSNLTTVRLLRLWESMNQERESAPESGETHLIGCEGLAT